MPREVSDIFLSSTSADLKEYRGKVTEMIGRLRQITIRMETFGAQPSKPLATCREEVRQCDALIVIVGHRYGWVPSKKEGGDGAKSITWWEVQWALEADKPVYAFLIDPQTTWPGEREQDRLTSATTEKMFIEVGHAVLHLKKFRSFLESKTTRELFTSAEDLAGKVASSLHDWLLKQTVAAVRASYATEKGQLLPPLPSSGPSPAAGVERPAEFDHLHWQEQVHLFSGRGIAGGAEGVRIALISGRANTDHPALSGASVRQFDARRNARQSPPDDYTTALAALLVGEGGASPYVGVAPRADLLILHVLDDKYSSNTFDLVAALQAALLEGAQVVCLPLSMPDYSEAERIAYRNAAESGLVVVCPVGNNSSDAPRYPAAYPDSISVGTVDAQNRLTRFSNFGDWVTTTAPGVDIPLAVGIDRYEKWSGTGFSCGIVAGVVALMLKANPKASPEQVKDILRSTGAPALNPQTTGVSGHLRIIDAGEAVRRAGAIRRPKRVGRAASRKNRPK